MHQLRPHHHTHCIDAQLAYTFQHPRDLCSPLSLAPSLVPTAAHLHSILQPRWLYHRSWPSPHIKHLLLRVGAHLLGGAVSTSPPAPAAQSQHTPAVWLHNLTPVRGKLHHSVSAKCSTAHRHGCRSPQITSRSTHLQRPPASGTTCSGSAGPASARSAGSLLPQTALRAPPSPQPPSKPSHTSLLSLSGHNTARSTN